VKHITFNRPVVEPTLQVRSNREQLIADIVDATTETDKKKLARRIALSANTLKWSDSDLHALLKKKQDPTIRSYTKFVWWSIKIT
jgi:hypothetical protein